MLETENDVDLSLDFGAGEGISRHCRTAGNPCLWRLEKNPDAAK
jgi:hypothetical protein